MTPRELEACATCDAYRRMADEWRARVVAVQASPSAAFDAGFRASGLSLTVYGPMMDSARAAFLARAAELDRKADAMPVSLAAVLLVLALVFVVLSAVRPFPLWPAVLVVILERAIALGWR